MYVNVYIYIHTQKHIFNLYCMYYTVSYKRKCKYIGWVLQKCWKCFGQLHNKKKKLIQGWKVFLCNGRSIFLIQMVWEFLETIGFLSVSSTVQKSDKTTHPTGFFWKEELPVTQEGVWGGVWAHVLFGIGSRRLNKLVWFCEQHLKHRKKDLL